MIFLHIAQVVTDVNVIYQVVYEHHILKCDKIYNLQFKIYLS